MEKLTIEGTVYTPQVDFEPENDRYSIEGRFISVDINTFFQKLFSWVDSIEPNWERPINIRIRLSYLNTSSTKKFFDFLGKLNDLYTNGCKIKIIWEYNQVEDEDLMEIGEDYSRFFKLPFEIKKIG